MLARIIPPVCVDSFDRRLNLWRQIGMPAAWSLLENIAGVDLDQFVPLIGFSTDVQATRLARKFASDVFETKCEVVNRTLFVATPK